MKGFFVTLLITFLLALTSKSVNPATVINEENANWHEWKSLNKKSYADSFEEHFRRAIWLYNLKKIEQHNMDHRSFSIGLNWLSDLTPTEVRNLMSKKQRTRPNEGTQSDDTSPVVDTLPKSVDWRKKGCVTPVINQGEMLGSWAVSAVGSLEGQHCIVTKKLRKLDVQKLYECCPNCFSVVDGFRYMIAHSREEVLPVMGNEGINENCNFSRAAYGASLTGYHEVPSGSEPSLQLTVALIGPVSVTIDAGLPSFQLYTSGVYDEPSCSSTQLDHAVLVVGYGTLNGKDYWLVKNSWGVNWGMKGYIMMSRNKDNQCGIATYAVYPTGVSLGRLQI